MKLNFIFIIAISFFIVEATAIRKTTHKSNGVLSTIIRANLHEGSDKSATNKTHTPAAQEGDIHARQFRLCPSNGPCKAKKLTCPKACSTPLGAGTNQTTLVVTHMKHVTKTCVLDCSKCRAYCDPRP